MVLQSVKNLISLVSSSFASLSYRDRFLQSRGGAIVTYPIETVELLQYLNLNLA